MADLDLAPVGNCIIASLIDKRGRHVWCCLPRFDGDPVFCSLLDQRDGGAGEAGCCETAIEELFAAEQRYVANTAIVETTLTDAGGATVRIIDFAPRFERFGRIFRPTMLIRRIEPVSGRARIRVRMRPRFSYGLVKPAMINGSNHVRYVAGETAIRLTTDAPVGYVMEEEPLVLDSQLH